MSMFPSSNQPVQRVEVTDRDGVVYVRNRQAITFVGVKSRTKQEFVAQADINNIIKKYRVSGTLPQLPLDPMFGDFSELPDYQESLNIVLRGQEAFSRLSSDVRTFFQNDPALFLSALGDEKMLPKLKELGVLVDPPKKSATLDDVVDAMKAREGDSPPRSE